LLNYNIEKQDWPIGLHMPIQYGKVLNFNFSNVAYKLSCCMKLAMHRPKYWFCRWTIISSSLRCMGLIYRVRRKSTP